MRRKPAFLFLILTGLVMAPTAAGAPPPSPLNAVREWDMKIRAILERPATKKTERETRLKAVVSPLLDYETHTRESLGGDWNRMTAAERSSATQAITVVLERSSIEKVRHFVSQKVEYLSEEFDRADPETASVRTRVQNKREVVYRMRWADGRWRIFDIVIEGASSVESNRAAFSKEIKSSGIAGLLEKLRKKANEKP